jgi:hypothetical protein
MKRIKVITPLLCFLFLIGNSTLYSQAFLNKLKEKAAEKAVNKVLNTDEKKDNASNESSTSTNSNSGSGTSSQNVQNTKGKGLESAPPNVMENIKSARSSFQSKDYTQARYATRQALLGVDMEMGQNVLKSLPEKADGMDKLPEEDKVTSSEAGFVGLFVQRIFQANDKQLKIVVESSSYSSYAVNAAMNNNSYTASNNNQNSKQVKLRGYNGLLQFDQNTGYTLSVPLGQSSVVLISGVNYADEKEFTAAANVFDIDKIKNELGEK